MTTNLDYIIVFEQELNNKTIKKENYYNKDSLKKIVIIFITITFIYFFFIYKLLFS